MGAADFQSVAQMFMHRVRATPQTMAFQFPEKEGRWGSITWREAGDRVRAVSSGLRSLGIDSEERCAILSSTRYEWILADLGIMCAGAATTTVYPSSTPRECRYILSDSAARIVFAEDDDQVAKLVEQRDDLPDVIKVVTIAGSAGHDGWVLTLSDLERLGTEYDAQNPDAFEEGIAAIGPDSLATLIYTSGTTGRPKGVELVHDCWIYTGAALERLDLFTIDDHQYLWLPLSHSFGKVLESLQLQVGFPTTVDGRVTNLVDNLAVIRPTFMAAAPRIFEKVYNRVVVGVQEAGGLKLKIFRWSVAIGRRVSALRQQRREPRGLLALAYRIADKLVFAKLKARFGGRLRFFVSGSAPLSREMAEFFHAAGILILEGYGLTESSAASFVNVPDTFKFGTVGPPLSGTRVRIAPEDGEVLLESRGIMRGYHNLPEETHRTLTDDGWLRTGDIGELDGDGFLRITDRKKDLIKTSGGKYIAPQKLEGKLKSLCPYLSQVLVHGNNRNFCTALVTLDDEGIVDWAREHGLAGKTGVDLANAEPVQQMVQRAIDELNHGLARHETIKKFAVLPRDLTVEDGELTASMKVKRKAVVTRYASILDGFYGDAIRQVAP